jgi:predicted deacylase
MRAATRPLPIAQIRKFKPELVAEVDRLLDRHCDREIADILNQRGCRTWEEKPFNLKKIAFKMHSDSSGQAEESRLSRKGPGTGGESYV